MSISTESNYAVFSSPNTWIEGKAIEQLKQTAQWPGIEFASGMPDLHPGGGMPIGAVWRSYPEQERMVLYPAMIGSDIGCGMSLWKLAADAASFRSAKAARRLVGLDDPVATACFPEHLRSFERHPFRDSLGTIGGGNHFAEIQCVETVYDGAKALGLTPGVLCLTVHSGSRGYGGHIYRRFAERFGYGGIAWRSADAVEYVGLHRAALTFAQTNRRVIAHRILSSLRTKGVELFDVPHNFISFENGRLMHRKGSVSMRHPFVVIPGSRGDWTYVVSPTPALSSPLALLSLAHGAGRKWMRSDCRGRLEKRYREADLKMTSLKSLVICEDRDLIYEEAPQAYKSVEDTVEVLETEGLCRRVARLRPVLTYKTMRR